MGATATKAPAKGSNGAAPNADSRTKTQYRVLSLQKNADGAESWVQVGDKPYPGLNDTDAIRAATDETGIEEGTFVGVPDRSFRPRTIQVKVRRTLSIT